MASADRHLLFGLLALQNGLIDQGALVAAFQAWTRDKATALADRLVARGDLDADARAGLDAIVALHVKKHGDVEKSLAAVPAGLSTRERLAQLADPVLDVTLSRVGSGSAPTDGGERTSTYHISSATSEGRRFRVLRPYARGGLGAVFVALDSELNREVALKQILDGHADDPTSRQRFLLEAEITGGLEHPGIVPVYSLGTYGDGRPYYAMRFIRGDSLKEAIERFHRATPTAHPGDRSLELRKLLRRFLDVCNAIEYAHSRGVLHRDIKPGNVIVGKHGETLVIDWGLAKALGRVTPGTDPDEHTLMPNSASGSSETLPGSALGTPAYMSPEQAGGNLDLLGPRSDVYSLGATLYCLLTGKPPFDGDVGEVLRKVQRGDFPSPRRLDPSTDKALEAVCLKAMATDPEARYPSCRALADEIERWIADEPVAAYRESVATRVTRWGRRHRTAAVSTGLLLVAAVVGLSVGAFLINRERGRAEANYRQARAAVDDYFTAVSESRLLEVPGLQPLRKELLDLALKYYRDFLAERGHDPSVRFEAATASFRVGRIASALGRPDEAEPALRVATALYEGLVRDHPGVAEYRRFAARGHDELGLIRGAAHRGDEAIAAHRKALAIREELARADPGNPQFASDIARSHYHIGLLYRELGKDQDARTEFDKAVAIGEGLMTTPIPAAAEAKTLTQRRALSFTIRANLAGFLVDRAAFLGDIGRTDEGQTDWKRSMEILEPLIRDYPDDVYVRALAARGYLMGSNMLSSVGKLREAEVAIRKGLDLQEGLVKTEPAVADYRHRLVEMRVGLGWLLDRLGRPDEAITALRGAIETAEGLIADKLDTLHARSWMARANNLSGNTLMKLGRTADALPMVRRAVEIFEAIAREKPKLVKFQDMFASAYRSLGRVEAAVGHRADAASAFSRAVEIEAKSAEKYPGVRFNQACSLALQVPVSEPDRREALAARAVEALRRSFADGYVNVSLLATDDDLNSLRARDDFRALLAEARTKARVGK